jgi:hypothetical protein
MATKAAAASQPPRTAALPFLPNELLLKIISHLSPGHSACLGLTCKRLYVLHRELHDSVSLDTRCPTGGSMGPRLYELLEDWHLPGFKYCWCGYQKIRAVVVSFIELWSRKVGRTRSIMSRTDVI